MLSITFFNFDAVTVLERSFYYSHHSQKLLLQFVYYKERNFIERFFNRIKHFKRIATRYDKTSIMLIGSLIMVAILIWIKLLRQGLVYVRPSITKSHCSAAA